MTSRVLIHRIARVGGAAALATTIAAVELSAQTPATPSTPTPGARAAPGVVPHAPEPGADTPRVMTGEVPPGMAGPQVTLTGCVRRIERTDTDSATIADVINRPMTAYMLEAIGGSRATDAADKAASGTAPATANASARATGLIAANQSIRLEDRVGRPVEISGTLRSPMAIGPAKKGADTVNASELQPVIVTSLRPANAKCK